MKEGIKTGLFWIAVGAAFLLFSQIDYVLGMPQ